MKTSTLEEPRSDLIFLPSRPTGEEWINILAATKGGCVLTGSAAMGQIGPILGHVDIGECEDSYLFRVSLPGLKRDEREFSCEVGDDGKVSIRGVRITREKEVCRCEQIFEMQSQKLCPPDHFSISFKLPGIENGKKKVGGPTRMASIWGHDNEKLIDLQWNERGQPIGENKSQFVQLFGDHS